MGDILSGLRDGASVFAALMTVCFVCGLGWWLAAVFVYQCAKWAGFKFVPFVVVNHYGKEVSPPPAPGHDA